jgi:hypothetical protein
MLSASEMPAAPAARQTARALGLAAAGGEAGIDLVRVVVTSAEFTPTRTLIMSLGSTRGAGALCQPPPSDAVE